MGGGVMQHFPVVPLERGCPERRNPASGGRRGWGGKDVGGRHRKFF